LKREAIHGAAETGRSTRDNFSSRDSKNAFLGRIILGTRLAISTGMPRKRNHCAPLALALDGSLWLNLSARLDAPTLLRVAQALSVEPADLFIGTSLPAAQRARALARIDDAAAEAAARIQGEAAALASPSARPRRKKRA